MSDATRHEELSGEDADYTAFSLVMIYFAGRFEASSEDDLGHALSRRALQDPYVEDLSPVCLELVDQTTASLDRADPGMEELERRVRARAQTE